MFVQPEAEEVMCLPVRRQCHHNSIIPMHNTESAVGSNKTKGAGFTDPLIKQKLSTMQRHSSKRRLG